MEAPGICQVCRRPIAEERVTLSIFCSVRCEQTIIGVLQQVDRQLRRYGPMKRPTKKGVPKELRVRARRLVALAIDKGAYTNEREVAATEACRIIATFDLLHNRSDAASDDVEPTTRSDREILFCECCQTKHYAPRCIERPATSWWDSNSGFHATCADGCMIVLGTLNARIGGLDEED